MNKLDTGVYVYYFKSKSIYDFADRESDLWRIWFAQFVVCKQTNTLIKAKHSIIELLDNLLEIE